MEEIKEKLLHMQQEIIEDLAHEADLSVSSITHQIGDDIDHASEERERELHNLLCERDRIKLSAIKQALEKIENNSYGYCEECDTKIGKKRLLALPFAQLCVTCQTEQEKGRGKGVLYDTSEPDFARIEVRDID